MGGWANRATCLGLPRPSRACPAWKAARSPSRHPQPCCHPALFKNNPCGTQPARVSPPGKGELAAPGCWDPSAPALCTWGYFGSFRSSPVTSQVSIAAMGPASPSHPHLLPVTRGGRSQPASGKVEQPERSRNPHVGRGEGASPDGCCCPGATAETGRGCHRSPPATGAPVAPQETWPWSPVPSKGHSKGFSWLSFLLRASPGSPRGWLVPALPVLHPAGAMATGRAISSIRAFAKSSLRRQTEPGSSPLLASRLLRWGAESTQGWGPALLLPSVPPSPSPGPSPPLCASAGLSVPRGTAFKGHNCNRHQQP